MTARHLLPLLLAASLVACQGQPPVGPSGPKATPRAPGPRNTLAPLAQTTLIGVVRAISDNGAGLLANNGAALISDKGGVLVSNNSGNLTSKTKFALAQATRAELPVATSIVEVLDPAGDPVLDAKGQPISAKTDADGKFRVEAPLPTGALLLRAKLGAGAIVALAPAAAGGAREVALDTAATLGARYVLGRLVADRPALVDRLPADVLAELRGALAGALDGLGAKAPAYLDAEMADHAAGLRTTAPAVDAAFKKVETLLLAGRTDLGAGLPATATSLSGPRAVIPAADGSLYVLETVGRVRRIGPDGLMATIVETPLLECSAFVQGPAGKMYLAARLKDRVYEVAPDGKLTAVLGTGTRALGEPGQAGAATAVYQPTALAIDPAGQLVVAEHPDRVVLPGRLLTVGPDGKVARIAIPEAPPQAGIDQPQAEQGTSMAIAPDGTIYKLDHRNFRLSIGKPGGAWTHLYDRTWFASLQSGLAVGPDGSAYLSAYARHQVIKLGKDGLGREPVVGTGSPGFAGDGGPATAARLNGPAGLTFGKDGTLYVAEMGNGTVRAVKDGTIRTIAGTPGGRLVGNALEIALNVPTQAVRDPQGRLVITETGGGVVKRLEAGELSTIAGGGSDQAAVLGKATDALLRSPTFAAFQGPDLLVAEGEGFRIRRVGPDGAIGVAVGDGDRRKDGVDPDGMPFDGKVLRALGGIATHPGGAWAFSDPESNLVATVRDGVFRRLLGTPTGEAGEVADGQPALGGATLFPLGLAYAPDGALHVVELMNMRVVRIGADGKATRFAGLGRDATLAAFAGNAERKGGGPARELPLMLPTGIAFAADGTAYVAEGGTERADILKAAFGFGERSGGADVILPLIQSLPAVPARIWRVGTDGTATIVAGPGGRTLNAAEGPEALGVCSSMAVEADGGLVIVDVIQGVVRRIPAEAL